ncbi:MAG TPA: hypothetical protein VFW44_14020 [Bryobacteraceae bacterium]|nr:hypothetical protein [Bryobacteraceae bacterium]
MIPRYTLTLALLAFTASANAASCDRECLRGFVTQYLNALVAHQPKKLHAAKNVRVTEDTVQTKLGAGALWKDVSVLSPYRLDFLDTREGVAAAFAIVQESGMPVMLVLRLKVADGKISEVETMATHNKAEGAIFKPEALTAPSAAMLAKPSEADRNSRDDLIKIAEHYPEGLKAGSFVKVDAPFADDAYRFENGNLMAGPGCTFMPGCDHIKTQKVPTLAALTYRVAAVDEDQGIVLLNMNFGPGSTRTAGDILMVFEAFKIYGGEIHGVEAFMKNLPEGTKSGWDSAGAR